MKLIATAVGAALLVGLALQAIWSQPSVHVVASETAILCRDGSHSFAAHLSGACSHHQGIAALSPEAPQSGTKEQGDAVVRGAAEAERRACAGVTVDEAWPSCAVR